MGVNIDILGIRELKGLEWVNLIQLTIISTTVDKNLLEGMDSTRVQNAVPGCLILLVC